MIQSPMLLGVEGYTTTKAIVSFPVNTEVPLALVKKLVKASLKAMKDKSG